MNQDNAIQLDGVSKAYRLYERNLDRLKEALSVRRKRYHRVFYALNDVSLNIKKGENVGIIGVNGSGKSTLLKIISGIVTPSSGAVEVDGRISAMLELGVGFNPDYTGIQNIYFNGSIMGYSRKEMDEKLPQILDFADIGDFIMQPVKTYSSGMFARLAFAVSINVQPEILIVDEVLSVGDTRFQIKCMERMHAMMNDGTTVLFVSHDVNAIRRFCSRAIWLNNGCIMKDGDVNETVDEYLDYQKKQEVNDKSIIKRTSGAFAGGNDEYDDLPEFTAGNNIAEFQRFRIVDENGHEVIDKIRYDQRIFLEIIYDVYEDIKSPVIGIAVKSESQDYVCGLNTLLDGYPVPWKYGRNRLFLEYTNGILALGGKYQFDVAVFDQTATVPIQYINNAKTVTVYADYVGEGRYIIPHKWYTK